MKRLVITSFLTSTFGEARRSVYKRFKWKPRAAPSGGGRQGPVGSTGDFVFDHWEVHFSLKSTTVLFALCVSIRKSVIYQCVFTHTHAEQSIYRGRNIQGLSQIGKCA